MKIVAGKYEIILDGEKIPVQNALGIFKSKEISDIKKSSKYLVERYKDLSEKKEHFLLYHEKIPDYFFASYDEVIPGRDKTCSEICELHGTTPEKVIKFAEEFKNIHDELQQVNYRYVIALIKDPGKYTELIDSIMPAQMEIFISKLQAVSLGYSEDEEYTEEDKKKIPSKKSTRKKNSAGGGIQKKKSKDGARSKKITNSK